MKTTNLIIYFLLAVIIAFGLSIYFHSRVDDLIVSEPEILDPLQEPLKRPVVRYPVPDSVPAPELSPAEQPPIAEVSPSPLNDPLGDLPESLPAIGQSDALVDQALTGLLGGRYFSNLVIVNSFIQRLVLTINNLPEKKLPLAHIPFEFPEGGFVAAGEEERLRISPENYQRYAPYLDLLEHTNPDTVIRVYVYLYPLLQTAYQQLGYPNAYFNDRLVYVLAHLLETPNPDDPLALERPSVNYTYADPTLENLSAGQKILLRMGQEQRTRVMSVLRNYHFRLTRLLP
ncbi:DUF3014 domain-containing protein [Pelovirga terrestris]|uniref:DUF3014 domain-containing protein n=1 Tax=Pelovirga terrestris TaxID=2771352 RepID=A0A8J6UNI2_9BACT|nr:DUF3014 domain-containing protein [Pelovirga terrestris]MBD1399569.1 DUF3014 domain-containing protein [Pelovirga terrestris]